uniref:Putative Xaa-Pro aminopeptidase NECHADRAFT_60613 n=1 Tax=Lygus hesperus TaxID=30085 RepID=A0A0A9XBK6_LYGHE
MLPSKGYFSKIPCVFYLEEGCGRPCCHYRHSVQDVISSQEDARPKKIEPNSFWSGAQINLVTKLVEKAVDKAFQEEPGGNMKIVKEEMMEVTLKKVLHDSQAVKWALSNKKCHNEVVPPYKPTPIAKLNNRHIPVVCVPAKPIPNANQFSSFRASTVAYSNRFDIDDASHGINRLSHYTGCSSTPLTYGSSEKPVELKYGQGTYDDDMNCFSFYSMEDSKNVVTDIQARNRSPSPTEFKTTSSEETAFGASSSNCRSMDSMPVQYNEHCSVNYVEVDHNSVTNFCGSAFDDTVSHQSDDRKRKCTRTNEETSGSVQNRTIHQKKC